jgi:putative aldouronate transport system permease protein
MKKAFKHKIDLLIKYIKRDYLLLILMFPAVLYYVIFHYLPMYGVVIAFKDFSISKGIMGSSWVGFKWFVEFFDSIYFTRVMRNTLLISIYTLVWGFPVPIIFALLLNQVKDGLFKRSIQTISYIPHFISLVIVVGLMTNFLSPNDGLVNNIIKNLGGKSIDFMGNPKWFRTLYISSGIWQSFGWNSIIYLAALSAIDPNLYEASKMEGANRFQQVIYITIPGILPTTIIMLILNLGSLMSVGFEKVILMYNPLTMETADVISSYVYRKGVVGAQYSLGSAVGLFNSLINFFLLLSANKISKKVTEISLW